MTVEPGFGGQSFMHDQLPKIAELRQEIDKRGLACELEVDGGVDPVTAKLVKRCRSYRSRRGKRRFRKAGQKSADRRYTETHKHVIGDILNAVFPCFT